MSDDDVPDLVDEFDGITITYVDLPWGVGTPTYSTSVERPQRRRVSATRTRKLRTTAGIVGLKLTKKDEVLCGVFGATRTRKPRTTEGRIVGLKLTDEDNGASDDPKFTGAEGECTPQAVNCYIDGDHDQQ